MTSTRTIAALAAAGRGDSQGVRGRLSGRDGRASPRLPGALGRALSAWCGCVEAIAHPSESRTLACLRRAEAVAREVVHTGPTL